MIVEQFFDKGLAHLSYVVISEGQAVVIDPARDSRPYFDFAEKHGAKIAAVIETHPHADFVSSHAEIGRTGATVYTSRMAGVKYPHQPFDEGDTIKIGKVSLKALNTPGHSPDSISIVLLDESGKEHSVFTGDTLFIGDVGRPDLRESAGNITAKREELARQMYHSLRDKLMKLPDETLVYPAHGPGSLCGKALGSELFSTVGEQKKANYALQPMQEAAFVKLLLENQPFIPKYFPYDVEINRQGADRLSDSLKGIRRLASENELEPGTLVVDARPEKQFKTGHVKGAINIQNGGKFETWLGSVVNPGEKFYLIADNEAELNELVLKAAKIGYEGNIHGALAQASFTGEKDERLDTARFRENLSDYTILDIRETSEVQETKLFPESINIPLPELRERIQEIPSGKPVVVHCAGGYRSAIGSSLLSPHFEKVYDLSEEVKKFSGQ